MCFVFFLQAKCLKFTQWGRGPVDSTRGERGPDSPGCQPAAEDMADLGVRSAGFADGNEAVGRKRECLKESRVEGAWNSYSRFQREPQQMSWTLLDIFHKIF